MFLLFLLFVVFDVWIGWLCFGFGVCLFVDLYIGLRLIVLDLCCRGVLCITFASWLFVVFVLIVVW